MTTKPWQRAKLWKQIYYSSHNNGNFKLMRRSEPVNRRQAFTVTYSRSCISPRFIVLSFHLSPFSKNGCTERKVYKAYISERKGPKHGFLICLWFYVRRKFERHEELDTGMRRTSRLSRHVYHWTNKQAFKWWLLSHNIKTWYLYPWFELCKWLISEIIICTAHIVPYCRN